MEENQKGNDCEKRLAKLLATDSVESPKVLHVLLWRLSTAGLNRTSQAEHQDEFFTREASSALPQDLSRSCGSLGAWEIEQESIRAWEPGSLARVSVRQITAWREIRVFLTLNVTCFLHWTEESVTLIQCMYVL